MSERDRSANPELSFPAPRNATIREALAEGKNPMLPFERHELEIKLLGHTATQAELGALLGEAMTTTSETWHDNAQADAITMQSHILERQAKNTIDALRGCLTIPYEQDEQNKVSVGSVVNVVIGGTPKSIFITGWQRSLPKDIVSIIGEDIIAISVRSPIGSAIFDLAEGDVSTYQVGKRQIQVKVVSIEHPNISRSQT